MSVFKRFRSAFRKGSQSNLSLAVYAIFLAFITWFIVSMTLYPSAPKTIDHVDVSIDLTGTSAADSGLSVISCDVKEVSVRLLGSRTQVGSINNGNLVAYIDASGVTTAGNKTLEIKVRSTTGIEYTVESITPASAKVVFDKYETRTFAVTPKIPKVSFAENKTINYDEFTCEPSEVNITGPSAQLSKISDVYAVSDKEMTLDSSYSLTSDEIQLYTSDGTLIDQSGLEFSNTSFVIDIPVLTQKTVGLNVQIVAPSYFDKDSVKFNMSAESITIASKNSSSEMPDTLDIGKIELSQLSLDFSQTFYLSDILEQNDCMNMSNLESVTVSLDNSELATKRITLDGSRFTISNAPAGNYEYTVITQNLPVDIVAPADIIDDITANDFIADINLLNADISGEQFTYPITITSTNYDNVWAVKNINVTVQRTEKEQPTTTAG